MKRFIYNVRRLHRHMRALFMKSAPGKVKKDFQTLLSLSPKGRERVKKNEPPPLYQSLLFELRKGEWLHSTASRTQVRGDAYGEGSSD